MKAFRINGRPSFCLKYLFDKQLKFVAVWISHEDNFTIDGIKVDINPITELKIGMLLAKNS